MAVENCDSTCFPALKNSQVTEGRIGWIPLRKGSVKPPQGHTINIPYPEGLRAPVGIPRPHEDYWMQSELTLVPGLPKCHHPFLLHFARPRPTSFSQWAQQVRGPTPG